MKLFKRKIKFEIIFVEKPKGKEQIKVLEAEFQPGYTLIYHLDFYRSVRIRRLK